MNSDSILEAGLRLLAVLERRFRLCLHDCAPSRKGMDIGEESILLQRGTLVHTHIRNFQMAMPALWRWDQDFFSLTDGNKVVTAHVNTLALFYFFVFFVLF